MVASARPRRRSRPTGHGVGDFHLPTDGCRGTGGVIRADVYLVDARWGPFICAGALWLDDGAGRSRLANLGASPIDSSVESTRAIGHRCIGNGRVERHSRSHHC